MLKVAHRGASGYEPENTMPAFARAIEMGADGIELDVMRCASGELVVFHDEQLKRLTGVSGLTEEHTLEELRALKVNGSQTIPTLEEVLRFVNSRVKLFIEIKSERAGEVIGSFMEAFGGTSHADYYLISFNHPLLARIRKEHRMIRTGAIMAGLPVTLAAFGTECGANSINPAIGFMSDQLVQDARKRNLEIFTWTCNTPRDIAKAKAFGVDGIMGDYLDRL